MMKHIIYKQQCTTGKTKHIDNYTLNVKVLSILIKSQRHKSKQNTRPSKQNTSPSAINVTYKDPSKYKDTDRVKGTNDKLYMI